MRAGFGAGLLGLLLLFAPLALAQRITDFSGFEQSVAQGEPELPWIIELRKPASSGAAGAWESLDNYIDRVQEELVEEMGWRNLNDIVRYDSVPMMAKSLDSAEARQLLQSDKVVGLYRSEWRDAFLTQSTQMVGSQRLNAAGQGGEGQVVAVIDNGVDDTHPFLNGRVIDGACFSAFGNCPGGVKRVSGPAAGRPTLDSDHGTHVAGIIAGNGAGRTGVAPGARLLAVQAFSRHQNRTGATDADLLAALDWVYQQRSRFPIAAVNLSLGGGAFADYCDGGSPYTGILRLLREAGIVPVIASGNDHNIRGIAAPACVSVALSIGSTDKQGQVSDFSNSWNRLSFLAPGGAIESSGGGGFVIKSGTSMAAPHVAGAIALLRGARPGASAEQVVKALTDGGIRYRDPRNGAQSVLIQVEQALHLIPLPAPVPTQPEPATPAPSRPPVPVRPAPDRAPVVPAPAPKPPAPRPDAGLPLCEENIDGITVTRQPPCRQGD